MNDDRLVVADGDSVILYQLHKAVCTFRDA